MKIAFVSLMKILPWGGSEELWYKAAKLAIAQGHLVTTLTQQWPDKPAKIAELQVLGADVQFYYTPAHTLLDRVGVKLKFKKQVAQVVPAIDTDCYVISCGTLFDIAYNREIFNAISNSGKKYVLVIQHNYEFGFIPSDDQRPYFAAIINDASACLFVSRRNMTTAARQLSMFLPNASVIDNPVNIRTPSIKQYPRSSKLLIACVARLDCDFKGQDILLEALSDQRWKGRNYRLNFYGAGPHHNHIKRLIDLYGLNDQVSLVGHVNDIDQLWEDNQVLVLPSLSEGTPLSLIEAMLSGRAALATNVGGNSHYITEETGFLASTASVECITESLEKLWNKKDSLREMGEAAFAHAKSITNLNPEAELLTYIIK